MAIYRPVCVVLLGRIAYLEAWKIQQTFARRYLDHLNSSLTGPEPRDTLLICEHEPVYTIGVRGTDYPAFEEKRLKELGADFQRTNRGGLITFHGPGQLVAYPILNLTHYKRSVRWYISQLERTVIGTCGEFGVAASISSDTGVWVKDNKVGAIGIQCSRYITTHGLSLNCNTNLSWFNHIIPCGIRNKGVTSLSVELKEDVTVPQVVPVFLQCFAKEFNCTLEEPEAKDVVNGLFKTS